MKIEKNHTFDKAEAISRLKALSDYWSAKYGIQTTWNDGHASFTGKFKGFGFKGTIDVDGSRLVADVDVPFLAAKMGKQYVGHKLDEYLDPSKSLAALQSSSD